MRKGFPTHCFQLEWLQDQRLLSKPVKTQSRTWEHWADLLADLLFPFPLLFFCWCKVPSGWTFGRDILKKALLKGAKMGICSKWTFCHVGRDSIGKECSITQVCPGRYLDHDHQLLCSSYKRCVLKTAISRQAPIIFNWVRLIWWLCTSYFPWTSTPLETRKIKKCCFSDAEGNTARIPNVSIQSFWQDTLT